MVIYRFWWHQDFQIKSYLPFFMSLDLIKCYIFVGTGRIERVIATRGARHVVSKAPGSKEQITVLGGCNAAGLFLPPMVILPSASNTLDLGPKCCEVQQFKNAWYCSSRDGWQTNTTFLAFLQKFYTFLIE
jgi:hypothetical protein